VDLPPEIIEQFRTTAIVRIEEIEASWMHVRTSLDEDASLSIQREIHTLKGESRMVGMIDVNQVCHRLEDLIDVARARGYGVDDEFDLSVTLALQFVAMLIRTHGEHQIDGRDVPGFIKHLESVLHRHDHVGRGRGRPSSVPPLLRSTASQRLTTMLRAQLGPAAVDAFIEYATAQGPRRDRLRTSWQQMRDFVGLQRAILSSAQLAKYKPSIGALARDLGKEVDVVFEIGTAEVTSEVLNALDVGVLHLVRNAVDHGIERTAAREAAGKPAKGTITLRGRASEGAYVLEVTDDGAGIDFERVRVRALELQLASPTADEAQLVEVMCRPGFSTRTEASDVSGRGIGLDAVRAGAIDLGGTLAARSSRGKGTTWTLRLPVPTIAVHNTAIRAPGLRFPIVLDPSWKILDKRPQKTTWIDLAVGLGFVTSNSISTTLFWFTNGEQAIGIASGGRPAPVDARRLVTTPSSSVAEVITIDSVEGLLIRPERIPGVVV
jgi:two-component system, chemotaxis family, sensor kinase CheA